jgi:hypothetical protein
MKPTQPHTNKVEWLEQIANFSTPSAKIT